MKDRNDRHLWIKLVKSSVKLQENMTRKQLINTQAIRLAEFAKGKT